MYLPKIVLRRHTGPIIDLPKLRAALESASHMVDPLLIVNCAPRKMDMLNGDLQLKNEATAKNQRSRLTAHHDDESEAGFHFIAFVPVDGNVWKLDGLERQPQCLGE